MVQDRDVVAEGFDVSHLVRREEDQLAGGDLLFTTSFKSWELTGSRPEKARPARPVRVLDQGRRELDLLLIALRQGLELAFWCSSMPRRLSQRLACSWRRGGEPAQLADVTHLVQDAELRVQIFLRQVAEARVRARRSDNDSSSKKSRLSGLKTFIRMRIDVVLPAPLRPRSRTLCRIRR